MKTRRSTTRGTLAVLLALALSLALLPAAASAARTPSYPAGSRATFTATKPSGDIVGGLYVRIAAKRRFDRYGELKDTNIGTFASMRRKAHGIYKYTTPPYTFDDWFMNTTGTYYWQISYTDCAFKGCHGHGPVHVFKVT